MFHSPLGARAALAPLAQAANASFSSLAQCAASWASYDAFTSTAVTYQSSQSTTSFPVTTDLTFGTGDVYTSSSGIPVASGNFTPTRVVQTVYTLTTFVPTQTETTNDPERYSATPPCSSISPSDCSRLYVSYVSSLGLTPNAGVPSITPAPSNSPQCPEYYYKPFSTCTYFTQDVETCFLSGANVQVFYFPSATEQPSGTITSQVVQSYAPGITFTSPSIYLSFDYLSAISTLAARQSICTSCGWDGCQASGVGGGNGIETRGTSVAGALISLPPEDVSTLLVSFPPNQVSSIVSVIAHGSPGFANYADDINYMASFSAKRLNPDHFTHPPPEDYYLRPEGAPGCNNSIPSPECSTIFEGMHRPILSLPSQVSLLQGPWATCQPAIYGVYDPPQALTEYSTVEGVLPGFTPSSTPQPSPAVTTPARPTSVWQDISPPSPRPDLLPDLSDDASPPSDTPTDSSSGEGSSAAGSSPGTHSSDPSAAVSSPTTATTTTAEPATRTTSSSTARNTAASLVSGLRDDHIVALAIAMVGAMVLL